MKKYRISGVPITADGSKEGRLVGILTNRDLRFETNVERPIADVMTREPLFTVPVGTTLDARARSCTAQGRKAAGRRSRLPPEGLITVKDIQKAVKYPNASKDSLGRLRCGAAIGVAKDTSSAPRRWSRARRRARRRHRARPLAGVLDMVARCAAASRRRHRRRQRRDRRRHRSADRLGVDAVKVGIGAGSICTTRIIAGIACR
jgi:IMP dehydrogenase